MINPWLLVSCAAMHMGRLGGMDSFAHVHLGVSLAVPWHPRVHGAAAGGPPLASLSAL